MGGTGHSRLDPSTPIINQENTQQIFLQTNLDDDIFSIKIVSSCICQGEKKHPGHSPYLCPHDYGAKTKACGFFASLSAFMPML